MLTKTAIIYLVGFMGAGKTCVGRRLAELSDRSFVDLDDWIEDREGTSIREIFRLHGEHYFRHVEREELQKASRMSAAVVALGGGAFCAEENQAIVKDTGLSVWLHAPLELLYARCAGDAARPLLTTPEALGTLFRQRIPFYRRADYCIEVTEMPVDAVARRIVQIISQNPSPSKR